MKHGVRTKKLGRTKSHREAMVRNLVRSLFIHERIRTTQAKAKLAQRQAERLIRYGQEANLAARRHALALIPEKAIVKKLFEDIAPRFKDRHGGCTRVLRLVPRVSDGAEMALLELVVRKERLEKEPSKKGK